MKYRYIDALRGIAILMVMIVHTSQYGVHLPEIIRNFTGIGAKGVQLFFMTSAFTLFLSHEYHLKKERFINSNFAIRRLFRIVPMYFLGIIYFSSIKGFESVGALVSNFLFLHGTSPYWINDLVPGGWSITVEMMFYAIVPYLVSKIKNLDIALKYTMVALFISIVLNFLLNKYPLINSQELWGHFLYYYFPNQLPIFCLGISTYFIVVKKDYTVKNITNLLIAGVLLMTIILILFLKKQIQFPIHFFAGVLFLGLILILARKEYRIFVNQFTCYLGKISFSAYLVHFAVLRAMAKYNFVDYIKIENQFDIVINFGVRLVLVVIITGIISSITYLYIESPFINIGKKIIQRRENRLDI